MKILSLPKHENRITSKNMVEKRRNFSSFPQYFRYSSILKSPITNLLNVVVRINFSSILQIWYVEVRISRSVSESPLEFEITRVDCIFKFECFFIKMTWMRFDSVWARKHNLRGHGCKLNSAWTDQKYILSSGHVTFIQCRINVNATSWPCIDVDATLSTLRAH